MESILEAINEWIKEILIGAINGNLSTMFGDVNEKVGTIAAEVGKTPQGWNANIFSMIQNLSENVIVPIAGLVITYVLCYELISMVTEKNNMHDIETFMFFKWFFKAFVAVFLVTHTFDITMAVFDMAQHIVSGAAGVIGGDTNIDVTEALAAMQEGLKDMEIPELLLLVMETSLVSLCMKIMSVLITVILYGRMIEIYAYCSVSPIPFATMTNREWGQIGNNYLKGLFALGFQGFLIMICLIGIIAAILFFIERDCDTSKNLRTIPVTNTQLIMAKISMLFIFSVAFCLISTLSVALFCKLFHVGMVYGMTYKIFMSLIFGVLIVAASLPIVFLIIYFNKSFLLSILLAFFYSIFNWGILGTIGTSISAAKIAFLNSFPVICVMNWTSGLMMDNLQKDNLLPEAYAIVPTTFHTIFIMAITVVLSLWLIIRFYKKWTR